MRGQFVSVTSPDGVVEQGRIKEVHAVFEDAGAGQDWLNIQTIPFNESELLESWYSILVIGGGCLL